MLEEALMAGRADATLGNLVEHFSPAIRTAAVRVAKSRAGGEWLDPSSRNLMIETLREAAHAVAFACGVELLPPFNAEIESPSVQRQMLDSMQRELAEQRAAGQSAHLQRAIETLRQFETMRQHAPRLRAGELLKHLSPADQGAMLRTLTMAMAQQSAAAEMFVVAGPNLMYINARDLPVKTQITEMPTALGPLRSVQVSEIDGQRKLLIGARGGVIVAPIEHPTKAMLHGDPESTSALGFSSVAHWNNGIWACHGEAGILGWDIGDAAPRTIWRPANIAEQLGIKLDGASGPRHLQVLDDARLIFAAGAHIATLDRDGQMTALELEPRIPVVGIVPAEREIVIVHDNGELCRRRRDTLEMVCHQRRGGRIIAAAGLPWLGDVRVLIAGEAGPVTCIGLDDGLVTEFASPHRGARILAGSPNVVAAVSSDRQRLILWHPWDGRKPIAELYVAGMTKHRIADVTTG
jgi:hypothetical protein